MQETAPLLIENQLFQRGFRTVAGVAAVGLGEWAGPIIAAVVVLPLYGEGESIQQRLEGVRYYHGMSRRECAELAIKVRSIAAYGVGGVSNKEIDQIGVRKAVEVAAERAWQLLTLNVIVPDYVLTSNIHCNWFAADRQQSMVNGESQSLSVAAAAVVAYDWRCDWMQTNADRDYPQYGFHVNLGHGSKFHREALMRHGASPLHRLSFTVVHMALEGNPIVESELEQAL